MRVLLIGDVVGKLGRRTVSQVLPDLRKKEKIDFVVANSENATHGRGIKGKHLDELLKAGVDFFTSGDHIFQFEEILSEDVPLIRPANYTKGTPGVGYRKVLVKKTKILLINLLGWVFLGERLPVRLGIIRQVENPFLVVEKILKKEKADLILVDFHAEATSEKRAMGFFLDGKVTCVFGTHTHVPSADAQVLPYGTGYVSDLGMTGAKDSVLGVEKEIIIERLKSGDASSFDWVEKGPSVFNSVLLETKGEKVVSMRRVDLEIKNDK